MPSAETAIDTPSPNGINHSLFERLEIPVGTTLQFPSVPYVTSRKEPDLFIRCRSDILPSFAIECGRSESWTTIARYEPFVGRWQWKYRSGCAFEVETQAPNGTGALPLAN
ncbi:hypothetical protein PCH_Pc21g21400 [Penicillium rubens Wisconsin 54-1255]|uniref:Uncharacterized protein n=1 Tax=Penicillium rubens (strain ATCC 28089 / DSM 1075 / NRRL 1951 / Wisconsin 54-1255) TaxID=500485 RepID=B6HLU2_PENRW|nr:hypothetical protein PCH_Pc21g21400 [Penicillium rubens Wisconsin 54-1255]